MTMREIKFYNELNSGEKRLFGLLKALRDNSVDLIFTYQQFKGEFRRIFKKLGKVVAG